MTLPLPKNIDEEVRIVQERVTSIGQALELPTELPALDEIRRIVTVFRELRSGVISVVTNGMALAAHFGDGRVGAEDVAAGMVGAIVKDPVQDRAVWLEYLETVARDRAGWKDLYRACREVSG